MFFDELSNDEWALLTALVSDEPAVRLNRRGRPRAEPRIVANAVLWILTTGEPWSKLPGRYPSGPTCRRRFEEWQLNGTLTEMIRLLSQTGRKFVYVPQAAPPVVAAKPAPQPVVASMRDDAPRGVSWKSPESWRAPAGVTPGWRSLDPLADMTRQLSGTMPEEFAQPVTVLMQGVPTVQSMQPAQAVQSEPAQRLERSGRGFNRADELGATRHRDQPRSPQPMSLASRGTQVLDRRGFAIYVAAERVPGAMYRAWAEIEQDGRRVERSGLVGPRFADPDAAQEYALEWARLWIERHCSMMNAAANAPAPSSYSRPLPGARSIPATPTVSSTGVHADAPVNAAMNGAISSPLNGAPMHGPLNALRAPLRRYPGETATESAADRFPTVSELISHAG
ncbi:transposase [Paraburkholderia sp.]|jgi:transposase|uniref:transposase n=1 Tax=Paraburkholderia sp. TaxID=1926495 RepID=UPI0039C97B3D